MPQQYVTLQSIETRHLESGSWYYNEYTVPANCDALQINVYAVETQGDIDIYLSDVHNPTAIDYLDVKMSIGQNESWTFPAVPGKKYYAGYYCYGASTDYSLHVEAVIKPTEIPSGEEPGVTPPPPVDVNTSLGNVTVNINQDFTELNSVLTTALNSMHEDLTESLGALGQLVTEAMSQSNNMVMNNMNTLVSSITGSQALSTSLIAGELQRGSSGLDSGISRLTYELDNGLFDLSQSINRLTPEPLVLVAKDISESIKGVSNGMIDDILNSLFTEKKT